MITKFNVIEGQINLFDLPIENIKPKENVIKAAPTIKTDKLNQTINLYSDSCNRIVRTNSEALLVELDHKTLYFNSDGVKEFELPENVGIMPGEEILIVNKDKEVNELQLEKLKDMNVKQYIKRKGDSNIIISTNEKTIVINPKGWVLEYSQKPKYLENEIFFTKVDEKSTDFKINDIVEIEYLGIKNKGKVTRVYNNGETINVSWNGQRTAFYYKCVKKVS